MYPISNAKATQVRAFSAHSPASVPKVRELPGNCLTCLTWTPARTDPARLTPHPPAGRLDVVVSGVGPQPLDELNDARTVK
jgi:hypothetical protein